mmetsp:Transcript_6770/g.17565  ORF Transcript_6770/g.17565 Transcript_6770/m.17565 type:complete len:217 (-) Transcript_6770:51-701(-)
MSSERSVVCSLCTSVSSSTRPCTVMERSWCTIAPSMAESRSSSSSGEQPENQKQPSRDCSASGPSLTKSLLLCSPIGQPSTYVQSTPATASTVAVSVCHWPFFTAGPLVLLTPSPPVKSLPVASTYASTSSSGTSMISAGGALASSSPTGYLGRGESSSQPPVARKPPGSCADAGLSKWWSHCGPAAKRSCIVTVYKLTNLACSPPLRRMGGWSTR